MNEAARTLKTIRTVGIVPTLQNGLYRLLVKAGWYRRRCPVRRISQVEGADVFIPLPLPPREALLPYLQMDAERIDAAFAELKAGKYHPFFGDAAEPLNLNPINGSRHWSAAHKVPVSDLKLVWESARFNWSEDLMRYEMLHGDGEAAALFIEYMERFLEKNPVNAGENWESAQEVAIRLIHIAFAGSVVLRSLDEESPVMTNARRQERKAELGSLLGRVIRAHAERIPETLIYAKSQRNNHLLSEALGLMTAGVVLGENKSARKWFDLGCRTLFAGLEDQIAPDGGYIQQSTNYHRLVLQIMVTADLMLRVGKREWPQRLSEKLRRTVRYLYQHTDRLGGSAANLGHNDGGMLFAFGRDYGDYRPTLQAASRIFLDRKYYRSGIWDETGVWLCAEKRLGLGSSETDSPLNHTVLRLEGEGRIALLHAAEIRGRAAHDDALQTDIWFNGINEVTDPGTFRYSGEPDWENALKYAWLHNGLIIDDRPGMTDGGKFRWFDQCSAVPLQNDPDCIAAAFTPVGGIRRTRTIRPVPGGFRIVDEAEGTGVHRWRLHWLLQNQSYSYKDDVLTLDRVRVRFRCKEPYSVRIIRAGYAAFNSSTDNDEVLVRQDPYRGWVSPTYNQKEAALSVVISCTAEAPFRFETEFTEKQ